MIDRTFVVPLLAGIAIAAPVGAGAQSSSEPALQDRWPAPTQQFEQRATPPAATPPAATPPATAAPAPETSTPQAQAPAAPLAPSPEPTAQAPAPSSAAPAPTAKSGPRPERKPAREAKKPAQRSASHLAAPRQGTAVACGGVFSHNSSHQALATAFSEKNVTFMEVDGGPEGRKLVASVVFPDDPKRRLEVMWENEGAQTDVYRIVISGQSAWTGPKGLHLGLSLAAIEKINGKPFKLRGFDESNSAAAIDWQEGALDSLPGGCNVGVFFAADPTVPQSARAEAAGAEFLSSDPVIRAVKPIVTEILFGYQQ